MREVENHNDGSYININELNNDQINNNDFIYDDYIDDNAFIEDAQLNQAIQNSLQNQNQNANNEEDQINQAIKESLKDMPSLKPEDEINQLELILSNVRVSEKMIDDLLDDGYGAFYLNRSVDIVGYENRTKYILGRLGLGLPGEDAEKAKNYEDMLISIKKDPRKQFILVLAAKYADFNLIKDNSDDFLAVFCPNIVLEGTEDEINAAYETSMNKLTDILSKRKASVDKASSERVFKENNQTFNLLNDVGKDPIAQVLNEIRFGERLTFDKKNINAIKEQYDYKAWGDEDSEEDIMRKSKTALAVLTLGLTDDEYTSFMLNLSYKKALRDELFELIKNASFDELYNGRFSAQVYFSSGIKAGNLETAKKQVDKLLHKPEEVIPEEKQQNEENNEFIDYLDNNNPYDDVNEEALNEELNDENPQQEDDHLTAEQYNHLDEDEKQPFKDFAKAYSNYSEAMSSMYNEINEFANRLSHTQTDFFANFDAIHDPEGSDSYQRLCAAVKKLMDSLGDKNTSHATITSNFKALYKAADDYYDDHYGFFGIKGTDKGTDRLKISSDIKKVLPKMLNLYNNIRVGVSVLRNDAGYMYGNCTQSEIEDKYNEIMNAGGENLQNEVSQAQQNYNQQLYASERQLKFITKLKKMSKTFYENYSYVRDVSRYQNIKPNMTDTDKAKYYVLKQYVDEAFRPGATARDVDDVSEKMSNGIITDVYKRLAKNPVFKECMRRHPDDGLREWDRIENSTNAHVDTWRINLQQFTSRFVNYITEESAFLRGLSVDNGALTEEALEHVNLIHNTIADTYFKKIVTQNGNRALANAFVMHPEKEEVFKNCIKNAISDKYGLVFNRDHRPVDDRKMFGIFNNPNITKAAIREFNRIEAANAEVHQQPQNNQQIQNNHQANVNHQAPNHVPGGF